jgi:hypothetical protein
MGGFVQFGKHQNHDPEEEEDTLNKLPTLTQNPKRCISKAWKKKLLFPNCY